MQTTAYTHQHHYYYLYYYYYSIFMARENIIVHTGGPEELSFPTPFLTAMSVYFGI